MLKPFSSANTVVFNTLIINNNLLSGVYAALFFDSPMHAMSREKCWHITSSEGSGILNFLLKNPAFSTFQLYKVIVLLNILVISKSYVTG
jgi:hypothetical protein